MTYFFHFLNNQFQNFLWEAAREDQPKPVNLEEEFDRYSFFEHHPVEHEQLIQIFQQKIGQGQNVCVTSLLKDKEFQEEHVEQLVNIGFSQLSPHPETGLILEHKDVEGWLIKKNYSYQRIGTELKRIFKAVGASDFPAWMLPASLRKMSKEAVVGVKVPNDVINPLRVVILKKGRQLIKRLNLTCVKAAKEYLLLLPDEELTAPKPLHERVVVIAKKENILNETENLQRFVEMAYQRPAQLCELSRQVSLLGRYLPLTDLHLHNIRFLNDATDRVVLIDGEPIGGLADVSEPLLVNGMKTYDPGFFSVLGLKKLQNSVREQMEDEDINEGDIQQVHRIFKEVISSAIDEIIRERRWHLIKVLVGQQNQLIAFVLEIFAKFTSRNNERFSRENRVLEN